MKRFLVFLLAVLLCLTGCGGTPEAGGEKNTAVPENELALAEERIAAGDYTGALEALAALDRYPQIEEKIAQAQALLDQQERAFLPGVWKEADGTWQLELMADGKALDSREPGVELRYLYRDGTVYVTEPYVLALKVTKQKGVTYLVGPGCRLISPADYPTVAVEIEITKDNWEEYFEVAEGTVSEGKGFYHGIALREEYASRVIPRTYLDVNKDLDVAFRVEYQQNYYRYTGNYPDGEYTIGKKYVPIYSHPDDVSSFVVEWMMLDSTNYYSGTPFQGRFSWCNITQQKDEQNHVKFLYKPENFRVLDATGTLLLQPDPADPKPSAGTQPTQAPTPAAGMDGDALLAAGEYAAAIDAFRAAEGYRQYAELKTLAQRKLAEPEGAFLQGVWTDRQNQLTLEFCPEGVFKTSGGQSSTYLYRDGVVYLGEKEELGYFLREERGLTCLVSPNGTFFRQEDYEKVKSTPVEITPENFWTYFEAVPVAYNKRDRFGEIESFETGTALVLKKEYQQRLDPSYDKPQVEVFGEALSHMLEILGDYPDGEYEIIYQIVPMTESGPMKTPIQGVILLQDDAQMAEIPCYGQYAYYITGTGTRSDSAAEYPYPIQGRVPAGDTRTFTDAWFFDEITIWYASGTLHLMPA